MTRRWAYLVAAVAGLEALVTTASSEQVRL